MNKGFETWQRLPETFDGLFSSGNAGPAEIVKAPDGRSEFVKLPNGQALVTFPSSSVPAYYPLRRYPYRPKAKAVLMDLDGTSIQSESCWVWIIESTVGELSVSEPLRYCIDKYKLDATLEQARDIYYRLTRREMKEILEGRGKQDAYTVSPGLKEFLLTLKDQGIHIGLVTSGLYEKAMPEILSGFRQMDMGDPLFFYDAVITAGTTYQPGQSGTLGELCAKPHPWLYREICEVGLGLHEEDFQNVVVLEDSAAGVMAGYSAGFDVIGVKGGNIEASGLTPLLCHLAENLTDALHYILNGGCDLENQK